MLVRIDAFVFCTLGGHTLSGACLEPRALNELMPDWEDKGVMCMQQKCLLKVIIPR